MSRRHSPVVRDGRSLTTDSPPATSPHLRPNLRGVNLIRPHRLGAIACALLATTALGLPSLAQAATPAPKFTAPDQNGVDLTTGLVWLSVEEGGIGSGEGRISMQRIWAEGAGGLDNWMGGAYKVTSGGVTKVYVQIAGMSDTFTGSGSSWTSEKADGATLAVDATYGHYIYSARDGTKIVFQQPVGSGPGSGISLSSNNCPGADADTCQVPLSITKPNGVAFTLSWPTARICIDQPGEPCQERHIYQRLGGVTSSAGYSASIAYASDYIGSGDISTGPIVNPEWFKRTGVTFNNTANPPSPQPTIGYVYGTNTVDVTDPANRTWRFTTDTSGRLTGVQRPGSTSNNIAYAYGAAGTVSSATKDGVTTSYARSVSGTTATATVTNALSQQTVVISDVSKGRPTSYKDALNRTTSYQYDANDRLKKTIQPELNYTELFYDARGNVTKVNQVAKTGTPTLSATAIYDATCSNPVKCNKPNSTKDARLNTTSYTYDTTHGGILTVTPPSPAIGVQPQTRYTYSQVTSASGALVYMLTGVAACPSGSTSCTTANEVKTSALYNSNLLPTSITRGTTSTALRATTTAAYDARGNVVSVDGPLTGTADATKYRYDNADQLVGVALPDPDDGGTLKHRATRVTYRPNGQMSKQELGTVNSQTDAAWTAFAPLQTVDVTFDSNSRQTKQTISAGGAIYAIGQNSYDALGRLDCTATRMNLAGTIPASACTQSTASPDRITQFVYDAAGQTTDRKVGVGTTAAATERHLTYTDNGEVSALADGNGNATSYTYDGFDRLTTTTYSGGTTDQNSVYDANGNVTRRINRAGQVTNLTYDKLNRVTFRNAPGTASDVTYDHDNLGRLTSASQPGTALSFTYDALSRNIDQTGPQGTVTSDWDIAGRRIKVTYPGTGLHVNYDYLFTGEMSKIRENGAASGLGVLASYDYDNLGARTKATYGNGTSRNYSYDPLSRLESLSITGLSDLAANLTIDNITYNAASQITSQRRTGTYAWSGYSDVTRTHTTNSLNQVAQTSSSGLPAPITFGYDLKGNLTSDGANTFAYDAENRLTSMGGASIATLTYDPFGRLKDVIASGDTTSFAYDKIRLIAEYDGASTLLRRYVFGPGLDEPIVQYEGSGTADRRWFYADERGSVMAIADGSANVLATNSYDEYGNPPLDAGLNNLNTGRFQYSGQVWLPELGLYYYRARLYSPWLGRFLQTDPIGYADSANLYAYVGNDPINFVDPLGLCDENVDAALDGSGGNAGCDITVTAARLPVVNIGDAPLVVLGPLFALGSIAALIFPSSDGHEFETTEKICRIPLTETQMAEILRRTAVPGHGGHRMSNGTYPVAGYAGYVTTTFGANYTQVLNTTTAAHAFVGDVVRTIYATPNGTFINTQGIGNAGNTMVGRARDALNQLAGPKIFNNLDGLARKFAQQQDSGC